MTEEVRNIYNTRLRQSFLWLLVFLWMALIFTFSARTAPESNAQSGRVIRVAAELTMPGFKQLPPPEQEEFISKWQHTVRKTAHVLAYLGLAILCSLAALQLVWPARIQFLLSLIIPYSYAVLDEIHQLFVAGRAFMYSDIGLDMAAASVGVLLVFGIAQAGKQQISKQYNVG